MTKVSIIITNYNYGKYLPKAIESVLNQDYPADQMEIILIDDASTDEATRRLVEEYEHPRVKKILLSENVGVVRARNIAIEQAGGGIFCLWTRTTGSFPIMCVKPRRNWMRMRN